MLFGVTDKPIELIVDGFSIEVTTERKMIARELVKRRYSHFGVCDGFLGDEAAIIHNNQHVVGTLYKQILKILKG